MITADKNVMAYVFEMADKTSHDDTQGSTVSSAPNILNEYGGLSKCTFVPVHGILARAIRTKQLWSIRDSVRSSWEERLCSMSM